MSSRVELAVLGAGPAGGARRVYSERVQRQCLDPGSIRISGWAGVSAPNGAVRDSTDKEMARRGQRERLREQLSSSAVAVGLASRVVGRAGVQN
ncbi:MAG: hypothetical protein CM1200mP41_02340 [Gammaproteobacteria bacterium]|nr:MAG: hypothetical protein CM1200mP41_02340 [Gammaproteobacteria bacterium]